MSQTWKKWWIWSRTDNLKREKPEWTWIKRDKDTNTAFPTDISFYSIHHPIELSRTKLSRYLQCSDRFTNQIFSLRIYVLLYSHWIPFRVRVILVIPHILLWLSILLIISMNFTNIWREWEIERDSERGGAGWSERKRETRPFFIYNSRELLNEIPTNTKRGVCVILSLLWLILCKQRVVLSTFNEIMAQFQKQTNDVAFTLDRRRIQPHSLIYV